MAVTLDDIAKLAKVSEATVSRVLNRRGDSLVSEATKQRVIRLAKEMGYRPNRMARSLATGRTNVIALLIPNLSDPYYVQVINRSAEELKSYGLGMITSQLGETDWHDWSVDGVLTFDSNVRPELFGESASGGNEAPVVHMGSFIVQNSDYVSIDLYPATREAVRHLISAGRKRVAYVAVLPPDQTPGARWDAYTNEVTESGLEPEYIVLPDRTRPTARRLIVEYIKARGCPGAIFCHNDNLAFGVYRGICDLGIRIPEDVTLVGCNGIVDCEYLNPSLSTIVYPTQEMCATACKFLDNRIKDSGLPVQQAMLQATLVIRESSRV